MNPQIYLILQSIIIFGILGSIENGFSTVYHDITHAVSSGVKGAESIGGGIAKGVVQTAENTFFGNFINYVVDPIFSDFAKGVLDYTRYLKEGIGDIFGVIIGVPLGLIKYIGSFLGKLGIIGLPAEMIIIGIGIVATVSIGLGIIKLVQAIGEIL